MFKNLGESIPSLFLMYVSVNSSMFSMSLVSSSSILMLVLLQNDFIEFEYVFTEVRFNPYLLKLSLIASICGVLFGFMSYEKEHV